jgi:hypothetical protein
MLQLIIVLLLAKTDIGHGRALRVSPRQSTRRWGSPEGWSWRLRIFPWLHVHDGKTCLRGSLEVLSVQAWRNVRRYVGNFRPFQLPACKHLWYLGGRSVIEVIERHSDLGGDRKYVELGLVSVPLPPVPCFSFSMLYKWRARSNRDRMS